LRYKDNYFVAENFETKKITYGFFSKEGGCSKGNYDSLNCSYNSGDNRKLVTTNINIAKKKLGLEGGKIKLISQIHSNKVEIIDQKNLNEKIVADGSITKDNNIALAIMTADCAPIFIFDLDCSFICCLHIGWKGCLNNIVEIAVNIIAKITSQELIAIIGPCLSKENFEVDEKFKDVFITQNLNYENFFTIKSNQQKPHFDMRGLINYQLQSCSVDKISNVDIDTYSNKHLFFSHRRSSHLCTLPTGRLINLIGFRDIT
jgi:hypothetical protein|tara:strand:- start:180 stop:959 length:780 start_codon:yes stop_codon:yes gene_type:complete